MSVSRIGFGFSVKKFPINTNFDVRVNCREEFNFLRYSSKFPGTSVGLSFLNSRPISVGENIIIRDLTESVPQNSPRKFFERIETSQDFYIETGDFFITDVFKTTSQGQLVPLYLRHDLSSQVNVADVEILDSDFNQVNKDLFEYFDESATLGTPSKYIYTNIESSYDRESNSYTIYYYRFRDTSTGRLIIGLLDAKPFYKVAEFNTPQTERAYRIETGNTQSYIQIWFNSRNFSPTANPLQQRFAIKAAGSDRIAVLPPLDLPPTQRWYPRITMSEFYRDLGGDRLYYYVPEYFNQFFSPVPPYKSLIEKEADILDERLINVSPAPIANLGITGFYIYVVLKDELGRSVRAFTNDTQASFYVNRNKVLTDVFYEKDMIQSVDSRHGFIRLNKPIDTSLKAYVTYRYEEPNFTYRDINVNSTINPNVLDTMLLFYVIPEGTTPNTRSLHHLQVDDSGNIVDSSESEFYIRKLGTNEQSSLDSIKDSTLLSDDVYTGYELQILTGANSGRRIKIDAYDPINKTLYLQVAMVDPIEVGVSYRINKRVESYSHYDEESDTFFLYQGWKSTYTSAPNYYVMLAEMFVIQTLAPRDIEKVDIRIRGGGVREKALEGVLGLQDEVQWYWDVGYWDGQPYPGMGAVVVEIPRNILQEVGGSFSRAQVQDIVRRHIAEGSYPIIRYYDQSTLITNVVPGNSQVFIEWQDVEAGFYNIYYGTDPNSLRLYRSISGAVLEMMVEGLDNDKTYFFRVESVVGGIPQLPSKTIMAIPFDPSTVLPGAVYGETLYRQGTYQNG